MLDRVEEILRAMCPDFPMPLTTIRPLHASIKSQALLNVSSKRPEISNSALASISSTCLAYAITGSECAGILSVIREVYRNARTRCSLCCWFSSYMIFLIECYQRASKWHVSC